MRPDTWLPTITFTIGSIVPVAFTAAVMSRRPTETVTNSSFESSGLRMNRQASRPPAANSRRRAPRRSPAFMRSTCAGDDPSCDSGDDGRRPTPDRRLRPGRQPDELSCRGVSAAEVDGSSRPLLEILAGAGQRRLDLLAQADGVKAVGFEDQQEAEPR